MHQQMLWAETTLCQSIQVPSPLNLWMNIPWTQEPKPCGSLGVHPPVSKPGDYIVMRAEMDCVVAFSACPQVTSKHLTNIVTNHRLKTTSAG